ADTRVPTEQVRVVVLPEPRLAVAVEAPVYPVAGIGLGDRRPAADDVHVGHLVVALGVWVARVLDDVGPAHPVLAPAKDIVLARGDLEVVDQQVLDRAWLDRVGPAGAAGRHGDGEGEREE